jgi:hypothetical protein
MAQATRTRSWDEPLVKRLIERNNGLDPKTIVERYADKLRRQAGQDELPIDVGLISSVNGIRRRSAPYNFAGRIYAEDNGQLVLDINSEDNPARQVFTEAHELIHTAFPGFKREKRFRTETSSSVRYPPNREEEYLCDHGAASLLMPAELVHDRFSVKDGLKGAEKLSRAARVSIEAACNRLVSLADEAAILLCLTVSHKPADHGALRRGENVDKKLRISYAFSRHLNVYVPRFKAADEESVFCRALKSGAIERGTEELPGAASAGQFRLEAKCYAANDVQRVLAVGRPTA